MEFLSLVVSVIVAIAGSGAAVQNQIYQPLEPIRVISTSHRIDYPDEIEFQVEVAADNEITEVELYYRFGRRNVTAYGYPEFTPSDRVVASFIARTDGGSYIPTGVDIEYFYVVRDAEGNELETEKKTLEFLDPSFDWQRLSAGDFTIVWHDRPYGLMLDTATGVNEQLQEVKALLGLDSVKPQKAVILSSAREAAESFPRISDTTSQQHVYGGFAFGDFDVFVLARLDRDGIIHEMTHLYIDEALDSPLARMPSWLNEGLAMYFESDARRRDRAVSEAAAAGTLLPLRAMASTPGRPQDVRIFYGQSRSVVAYMMDTYGRERMSRLIELINEGESIDEAVQTAYGMSLDELDAEWREGLARDSTLSNVPDPGTVGTSAIIGAALALTVIVVSIRWLRRIVTPPNPEDADL